jgi:hypothetical protein
VPSDTANPASASARTGLGIDCFAGSLPDSPKFTARQAKIRNPAAVCVIQFDQINRAALSALPAVLARLIPGGKILGQEYVARNPTRADRRAGSFKVNLRTGRWSDFAIGAKGGDPVSLVAYVEGVSQAEAARRLARMLAVKLGECAR